MSEWAVLALTMICDAIHHRKKNTVVFFFYSILALLRHYWTNNRTMTKKIKLLRVNESHKMKIETETEDTQWIFMKFQPNKKKLHSNWNVRLTRGVNVRILFAALTFLLILSLSTPFNSIHLNQSFALTCSFCFSVLFFFGILNVIYVLHEIEPTRKYCVCCSLRGT